MRLLVDLFPCQTVSRLRGIGRYTLALTQALARVKGGHQLYALADAQYSEACDALRTELSPLLGPGHFATYAHSGAPFAASTPAQRQLADDLVSAAYRTLAPDVVLCMSPFEDWTHDGIVPNPKTRVGSSLRAAVLYDVIPWLFPEQYLKTSPSYKAWYTERLQVLKSYDLLLAISEATRSDAIEQLGLDPARVAVIGGAADERFHVRPIGEKPGDLSRLGIQRPFVLYTGNGDYRKNLFGMLQAYARLPEALRNVHQLVVNQVGDTHAFWRHAQRLGLKTDDIVVTGHVADAELVALYQQCTAFVFPSLYEGFGLPVLEAMACGAPVIAADNSSIPEVLGRADVMFDAKDPDAIKAKLEQVLTDVRLRQELKAFGPERAARFNWDATGRKAWQAFEETMPLSSAHEHQVFQMADARAARSNGTDGRFPSVGQIAELLPADVRIEQSGGGDALETCDAALSGVTLSNGLSLFFSAQASPPVHLLQQIRTNPGVLVLGSAGIDGTPPEIGVRSLLASPAGTDGSALNGVPPLLDVTASSLYVIVENDDAAQRLRSRNADTWCPPIATLEAGHGAQENLGKVIDAAFHLSSHRLVDELAETLGKMPVVDELLIDRLSACAGRNMRLNRQPRLLIDVSQLAKTDARSGIQRVVRNMARELCLGDGTAPVEIVQIKDGGLVRAKDVVPSIFNLPSDAYGDARVEIHPGDVLLMIDSSWEQYEQFLPVFQEVRQFGGRIVSVVYDLIPALHPEYCSPGLVSVFNRWLRLAIMQSDMLICISEAVKQSLGEYIDAQGLQPPRPIMLEHWNLGADLINDERDAGIRPAVQALVEDQDSPLYLMVGTIEPRKGHAFVLDAFEQIWAAGGDARLCLAGKEGWHVEALMDRIHKHPMNGKRLFLIDNFTDAEINRCYAGATALIAASTIEGYGLPIVEAAMHHVPVLASDIPVFREVGGEGALFFQLGDPSSLAEAAARIAAMSREERQALAGKIRPITWRESARQLACKLYPAGIGGSGAPASQRHSINSSSGTEG
ncbi:glycosyltransferase family 1 protein [Cupriavidus sp. L7L]|uniref:glycosyltransferase family 4 protein n=1 Tax=Cupriavidus sp. L7L TaxID=2546443 RepID=UPI0010547403|nr:glycosyltransferase family 1 protein [Cupriavidus sp. L7L]TDF67704.1 glycosyltransferase family 1 protein [Cupriavidus sp. L7L]